MIIIIIIISVYKDMEFEVIRMCKVKEKTVLVIIGALRTIKKGFDQNLQLLPGHPLSTELQATLMSNARIILIVLG